MRELASGSVDGTVAQRDSVKRVVHDGEAREDGLHGQPVGRPHVECDGVQVWASRLEGAEEGE